MVNWNDPRLARLEQAGRAAWVWDAHARRISWATDAAAQLWGIEDAFLLVDRVFGESDPTAKDLTLAAEALEHTEGIEIEIRLIEGGRARRIDVMARRFARGPEGDLILVTLRARRAAARDEHAAAPNPIADLLGSFPLGLALFSPQGQGLYANPAFARIFGPARRASFAEIMGSRKAGERLIRSILGAGSIRVTPTLMREDTRMTIEINAALIQDPVAGTSAFLVEAQDISGRRGRERQLCERFELLRSLLSSAVDGWLLLDAQLQVKMLGGALVGAAGRDGVRALGAPWREAFALLALARTDEVEAAIRAHEIREVALAGEPARQLTTIPKWSEDGDFLGLQLIISPLRKTEAAAPQKPVVDLGLALDLVPAALLAHDNFEIAYANERAAKLFGAEAPQALVGRPFLDLFREDERRASRHYDDLYIGEREVAADALKARRLDGGALVLDARFRYATIGARQVVLAGFQDVTRHAGAPPSSEETRAPDWIAAAPTPLLVLDKDGRIARVNEAAAILLKLAPREIEGRDFEELIDKRDRPAFEIRKAAAPTMTAGLAATMQLRLHPRADHGVPALAAMRASPSWMDKGFIVALSDLAAFQAREEEIMRSIEEASELGRQKTEFLTAISHEMRTPLNAIIGFSEFMKEGRLGPIGNEKYAGYVDDIHMSGQHLLSRVNDLLDMSKIEAGRYEVHFETVDVEAVIEQALRIIRPQADKKSVRLVKETVPVPNVIADQRSLRQILLNLLSNAVKFTPGAGAVSVKSSYDVLEGVAIEVSDTGIGMSAEDLAQALQPYRQVHSHANDEGGTGLGLPLAKALTEANHARFLIESAPDKGTRAKILFPAAQVAEVTGEP